MTKKAFFLILFAIISFSSASMAMEENGLIKTVYEFMKTYNAYFSAEPYFYERAIARIDGANTKDGKEQLFLEFAKAYAGINSIPLQYTEDAYCQDLLRTMFEHVLELDKITVHNCYVGTVKNNKKNAKVKLYLNEILLNGLDREREVLNNIMEIGNEIISRFKPKRVKI